MGVTKYRPKITRVPMTDQEKNEVLAKWRWPTRCTCHACRERDRLGLRRLAEAILRPKPVRTGVVK